MRKLIFILFFSLCSGTLVQAQEGLPVYFDYLTDNYYLVYPSLAGIGEGTKIRLTARKQWFDVRNAPNLQTVNAHFRIKDSNSGVGGLIFNDENGFHSQTGIKLTYAHHLKLASDIRTLNQLSFGLSTVALLSSLDETEFRSVEPDPLVTGVKSTVSYFNIDLGMSYSFMEFYAHVAIQNVLDSERRLYRIGRNDPSTIPETDNLRRYLFSVGYVFGKKEWQVEPSLLYQQTEFTSEKTLDINAKVYRDVKFGKVWAGLSYRRGFEGVLTDQFDEQRLQLFTPLLGVNYKKFLFAYNYSYQSGDIRAGSGGFHQITLGFDFGQSEKRLDCNCPAANY